MADRVCLNADKTKQVSCDSPEAAWVYDEETAKAAMAEATSAASEPEQTPQPANKKKQG